MTKRNIADADLAAIEAAHAAGDHVEARRLLAELDAKPGKIHLANVDRIAGEAIADALKRPPRTVETLEWEVVDITIALYDVLDAFWRMGGEDAKTWLREHYPMHANRLAAKWG